MKIMSFVPTAFHSKEKKIRINNKNGNVWGQVIVKQNFRNLFLSVQHKINLPWPWESAVLALVTEEEEKRKETNYSST